MPPPTLNSEEPFYSWTTPPERATKETYPHTPHANLQPNAASAE